MDWNAAIERNREALKRIVAALVAMAGLAASSSPLVGFDAGLRGAQSCRAGGTTTGGEGRDAAGGSGDPAGRPAEPGEGCSLTLPRHLHRAVLRLLRPAESAARRLVIVAARDVVVALPPQRPRKAKPVSIAPVLRSLGIAVVLPHSAPHPEARSGAEPRRAAPTRIALPLFDEIPFPRPRRPRTVPPHAAPRILTFDGTAPHRLPPPPSAHDPIDATRLTLRLEALDAALHDLPGHARRFARWRARRRLVPPQFTGGPKDGRDPWLAPARDHAKHGGGGLARSRFRLLSPLRPGRPPGLSAATRRRPSHEVHGVLADLHYFAFEALARPDTS